MTIHFTLNCELNVNNFELTGLEEIHNSHHRADVHQHSDDNSLESLKGDAALKFDADLSFDMQPEEMKACYSMIEALGGKFAEVAKKSKDLGEHVVTKINQQTSEKQPKVDDENADLVDVNIRIKDALRRAERNIEENESDDASFKIDLTDLRTASRLLKEASEMSKEYDLCYKYDQRIAQLRTRLAALNDKC